MCTILRITVIKLLVIFISMFILWNVSSAKQAEVSVPENEARTHYMLGILGYNYTNEDIAAFSIDGQGGGDIRVSTPTEGGGGTVCCVLFSKNPTWPIKVRVRWQSGGCRVWHKNGRSGHNQYYYKEALVNVEPSPSAIPAYISAHFYKDGSVRVRLLNDAEFPLLKLPSSRAIDEEFPECKSGEPVEYL